MNELTQHKHFPFFTILLSLVVLSFYGVMSYLSQDFHISYVLFEKFGAPYAIQIYDGQYWGVVVNSLVHAFPLHIATNLIGLWVFGAFLERRIGWFRLFVFGLVSSVFSSLAQLAFTNDAGLGLSGVNYALFGLIFVMAINKPIYKMKFHYWIGLFMIGFLFFSLYMNTTYEWYIAVESEIAGLFWGVLIGLFSYIKSPSIRLIGMVIPFGAALITLFYAPWSSMWQCQKAIEHHENEQIDKAIEHYDIALKIEPTNKVALLNKKQISINELAEKAYQAHQSKEYIRAHRLYLKILAIDHKNAWAKNNMKALP